MVARTHEQDNATKLLKVDAFSRPERVLLEEWNDALDQMLMVPHPIRHSVTVILSNHAAPEVGLDRVKQLHIAFVLDDGELR